MMTVARTKALSLFFSGAQQAMQAARTVAELERAGDYLTTPQFDDLPEEAREDLVVLYAHRLQLLTGAFIV